MTSTYEVDGSGLYQCEWPSHYAYAKAPRERSCRETAVWRKRSPDSASDEPQFLCPVHFEEVAGGHVEDDFNI